MAELAKRHPRDVVSLVLGLLLIVVAGLYLLGDLSDTDVDVRWIGPAALIATGVVGLTASARRRDSR